MQNPAFDYPIARRTMLVAGAGSALLTTSCGFFSTDPEQESGPEQSGSAGALESPMLTKQVEAGKLPPLEERLPTEPLVVQADAPGRHGGTLRSPTVGPGDNATFWQMINYEPPLRMDPMVTKIIPGVCTEITRNDAGTEFTMKLRKGMRWSDGEPFTAEDIAFAIEDVFGNEELYPTPPTWLSQDGELATVRVEDDSTVTVVFANPDGTFYEASTRIMELVRFPKHYAKQFLPKYNDKADQEAKDNDYQSWVEYWGNRLDELVNPDRPTVCAWVIVTPVGEGQEVVLERNPYYWKTDADGRQLPYIDKLVYPVVQDPQVIVLKTTSGEFDVLYREGDITVTNKPVFAKAREDGGYEMVDLVATYSNTMAIQLNLCNKNKAHRKLYQNRDFRIGLSHAIDRKELITAVWQRQGDPWQVAPYPQSDFYDEEFATQYTAFDQDRANQHLDQAGITQRDKNGFRTLPSGDRLTINLDVVGEHTPEWPAAAAMIKEMWADVGIRMTINSVDRTLFYERKDPTANEHDASVWFPTGGYTTEMIDPRGFFPYSSESLWATPWASWFSSRGTAGERPIAAAKEQIELFWKLEETPAQADREAIFRQILEIAKEQFWVIGISSAPTPYLVVRNRLKNVIGGVPFSWAYRTPAHANPEAWYLDEQS